MLQEVCAEECRSISRRRIFAHPVGVGEEPRAEVVLSVVGLTAEEIDERWITMRAAITMSRSAAQANRRAMSAWTVENSRKITFIGTSCRRKPRKRYACALPKQSNRRPRGAAPPVASMLTSGFRRHCDLAYA